MEQVKVVQLFCSISRFPFLAISQMVTLTKNQAISTIAKPFKLAPRKPLALVTAPSSPEDMIYINPAMNTATAEIVISISVPNLTIL